MRHDPFQSHHTRHVGPCHTLEQDQLLMGLDSIHLLVSVVLLTSVKGGKDLARCSVATAVGGKADVS